MTLKFLLEKEIFVVIYFLHNFWFFFFLQSLGPLMGIKKSLGSNRQTHKQGLYNFCGALIK
jgi:hypothetical protein